MTKRLFGILDRLKKSGLGRNILASAVQPIVGAVCLLLAYRILTVEAGLETVGLWSLLMAGTLVARAADVSGVGALARFLAQTDSRHPPRDIVHTVLLTSLAINSVVAVFVVAAFGLLIHQFIAPRLHDEAVRMAPLALVTAGFLTPLAIGVCAALDGLQRADLRAALLTVSSLVFLFLAWVLTPTMGGVGFGLALLSQQALVAVAGWGLLARRIPGLDWGPFRWSRPVFRDTVGFGVRLQLLGLALMLTEPVAKAMLGVSANLSFVAYYEFALRVLNQLRAPFVGAAQPLIPVFAAQSNNDEARRDLFGKAVRACAIGAGLFAAAVLIISAPFSLFMLGELRPEFLMLVWILGVGFAFNLLAVPHYVAAIGAGVTRWNLFGQIAASASLVVFGGGLAYYFGGVGVVVALSLGVTVGAVVQIIGNSRQLHFPPRLWLGAVALGAGGVIAVFAVGALFFLALLANS
jgi:O-antigen/teichoic acid export membrane protein